MPLLAIGLQPHLLDHPRPIDTANMFGFKDGTNNLKTEDPPRHSTSRCGSPAVTGWPWPAAIYLVSRRIRMRIEPWDRAALHRNSNG